jgi:sugar lactone lactonase YvrE
VAQSRVDCVLEARNVLGEGPVWDRRDNRLFWVDIRAPALLSFDPASGKTARWPMPAIIGCAVPRAAGGFLLADGSIPRYCLGPGCRGWSSDYLLSEYLGVVWPC